MKNVKELENILRPIINDQLLRFPIIMQAYIGTFMKRTTFNFDTMKTQEGFRNPNTGQGSLRILKGNLFRSFAKGNVNNIYKLTSSGTTFSLEYGSSVKYALIHEYGGTINHPGGTPYISGDGGKAIFVKKSYSGDREVKYTKPHSIKMPARPYFEPALDKFKSNDKFKEDVKAKVLKGVIAWQESQRRSQA
jgi:phage gpG-like protein